MFRVVPRHTALSRPVWMCKFMGLAASCEGCEVVVFALGGEHTGHAQHVKLHLVSQWVTSTGPYPGTSITNASVSDTDASLRC